MHLMQVGQVPSEHSCPLQEVIQIMDQEVPVAVVAEDNPVQEDSILVEEGLAEDIVSPVQE